MTCQDNTDNRTGLQKAIAAAGSQAELARRLGLDRRTVNMWTLIPARHIVAIELATGVPREELRPDLYRVEFVSPPTNSQPF